MERIYQESNSNPRKGSRVYAQTAQLSRTHFTVLDAVESLARVVTMNLLLIVLAILGGERKSK